MEKLIPNTVIYEHYLLKYELSVDPVTGQRVWSVQDQETGLSYIVRFNQDGTNEWFNDNRPESPKATETKYPEPPTNQSTEPTSTIQPVAPVRGKVIVIFVLILAVLGTSFFYQASIVSFVKELFSHSEKDSSTASDNQDITIVEKLPSSTDDVNQDVPSIAPPTQPEPTVSHFTVPEAVQALNSVNSSTSYQSTFEEARKAFAQLEGSNPALVDSIYVHCAGQGAKAYFAFQQTKDQNSKRYSYEWYQTAYVLKPSPDLLDRLERLK